MTPIEPSRLRHLVTIQEKGARVATGGGGYTASWADLATDPTWDVEIRPLRGTERLRAMQTQANATHVVTGRWREDVTAHVRLVHEGRILEVVSPPMDPEERHELLEVLVREET